MTGPATAPSVATVMLSEFAAGSSASGTIVGSSAPRAGWLSPKKACCIANTLSSTHTLSIWMTARNASSALVTMRPTVEMMRSLRRSTTSASDPPQSPKTMSGTSPKTPLSPTYPEDPVMWKICAGMATTVICAPSTVTMLASHSRR